MIDDKNIVVKYDITYKCNYCCDYCTTSNHVTLNNAYEPTKSDIDKLFSNLKNYNIKKFILYGGEPTLSDNLFYCLDKLLETNNVEKIDLCTNGSRIDVMRELSRRYGSNLFFIHYGVHLKYLNIDVLNEIASLYKDCLLNIVLDKRYKLSLYLLSDFLNTHTTYNYWLSFVKNKRHCYENRFPFKTSIYSDAKFLLECSKMFKYDIKRIYERFHTPKRWLGKICVNNIVDICSDGTLVYDCIDCFNNVTHGNVYKDLYIHNFQHRVCDILVSRNFGYCNWCDHIERI